jgi:hypothetical protein
VITLPKLTPYTGDVVAPSPNHDARGAAVIQGIVLHATADAGNEARSVSWMRSPESQVSCHLLVNRNGRVTRLVGDQQRAWHAGLAWWRGTSDVNSITLGIEIANRNDGEPYTDAQYDRVAAIVAHYCRQGLSLDDVVGHGEIAPGRRTDPLGWNWARLRAMVQDRLRPAAVPSPSIPPARAPVPGGVAVSAAPAGERRTAAPPKQRVPAIVTPKPILRSRTLWLNGLTVLAAGSVIVGEILDLTFWVGLTLPQEITMWALFGVGLVNIVLRFRTSCPIGGRHSVRRSPPESPMAAPGRVRGYAERGVAVGRT